MVPVEGKGEEGLELGCAIKDHPACISLRHKAMRLRTERKYRMNKCLDSILFETYLAAYSKDLDKFGSLKKEIHLIFYVYEVIYYIMRYK